MASRVQASMFDVVGLIHACGSPPPPLPPWLYLAGHRGVTLDILLNLAADMSTDTPVRAFHIATLHLHGMGIHNNQRLSMATQPRITTGLQKGQLSI